VAIDVPKIPETHGKTSNTKVAINAINNIDSKLSLFPQIKGAYEKYYYCSNHCIVNTYTYNH
jgi:hypothetical protein